MVPLAFATDDGNTDAAIKRLPRVARLTCVLARNRQANLPVFKSTFRAVLT